MKLQNTIMYAVKELLANLKNKTDKEVVEYIARAIGLPHNLAISDENAPLLATLLMYYGFKVTDTCTAPN
jgi:predicted nucleotide-binding protein (sugar kinase/HSP70/actin superfamily)